MAKRKKPKAKLQRSEGDQRYADRTGAVPFAELWSNLQSSANTNVRTLGEILSSEPRNNGEKKKLEEFRGMESKFFGICRKEIGFPINDDALIKVLIQRSNRKRDVRNGQFHYALMTQHKPESVRLLKQIITDVRDQVKVFRERSNTDACRGDAKSVGYGGYQSDCCQECGNYLYTVCYSIHRFTGRVPRTDKICKSCYFNLPSGLKSEYARYVYSSGWTPRIWGGLQK